MGLSVLRNFDVFAKEEWYWIGAAALFAFTIFYNVLFTLALMYLNRKSSNFYQSFKLFVSLSILIKILSFFLFGALALGKKQAIISEEDASEMEIGGDTNEEPRLVRPPQSNKDSMLRSLSTADGNNASKC